MISKSNYSGPIEKLAKLVTAALVARGMSLEEADTVVLKLIGAKEREEKISQRRIDPNAKPEVFYENGLVRITNVRCRRETAKAILVTIFGRDYWFPLSQIDEASEVYAAGCEGDLLISQWIAKKHGFVNTYADFKNQARN